MTVPRSFHEFPECTTTQIRQAFFELRERHFQGSPLDGTDTQNRESNHVSVVVQPLHHLVGLGGARVAGLLLESDFEEIRLGVEPRPGRDPASYRPWGEEACGEGGARGLTTTLLLGRREEAADDGGDRP